MRLTGNGLSTSGLRLQGALAGFSTIRGLIIDDFHGDAITVSGADYNIITCNELGTGPGPEWRCRRLSREQLPDTHRQ